MDRPTRILLWVVVAFGLAQLLPFSRDQLMSHSFDDACYFIRIAENAAHGYGFTFDRINPTNGYQPLWLYVLIPIQWLPLSSEARFFAGLLLQWAMLSLAAWWLFSTLASTSARTFLMPSLAAFAYLVFLPAINGMETAVQIVSIVALFAFGYRMNILERPGRLRPFSFGLLIGVSVLARLDDIFLATLIACGFVVLALRARAERRAFWIHAGFVAAGAALVLVPYLAYNHSRFGAIVPISGQIKSSFPQVEIHGTLLDRFGVRGLMHIALAVGYLVVTLWPVGWGADDPYERRFVRSAAVIGSAALLLHATNTMLFMKWATFRWHFVWYGLVTSIVVLEPLRWLLARPALRRAMWLAPTLGAMCVVIGAGDVVRSRLRPHAYDWHDAAYDEAIWARAHVPRDAIMAMHDAGVFGYFSGHRVINLDGVVNTMGYQDSLRAGRWADYLKTRNVEYIVKHDFGDIDYGETVDTDRYASWNYRVFSHRYEVWSDRIQLNRADEVHRSRRYFDGAKRVVAAIWRWRGDTPNSPDPLGNQSH